MLKTVCTYYGGKQRMLKYILPNIPPCQLYCEPMVGGGAVFISKQRSPVEIINDLDGMIATFYRVMKRDFERLRKKVEETLYDRKTHKYALFIRQFPHDYDDLHIAWAFFVLTAVGFSGTLNSFGCYSKGTKARTLENKKKMFTRELMHRFEGVQIESMDGHTLIKRRDGLDTFFYVDPPYPETHQSHYAGYTMEMFTQLLDILKGIEGKFMLSCFPNDTLDRYIKKYGWSVISVEQSKSASRNKDGTKKRKIELLVANYPIAISAE